MNTFDKIKAEAQRTAKASPKVATAVVVSVPATIALYAVTTGVGAVVGKVVLGAAVCVGIAAVAYSVHAKLTM
jgi:hypothetical protein